MNQELEQKLQAALLQTAKDLNAPYIGVTVGVVTPDSKWTGATGVSNLETQQATKTDDLFNIASISKSYTSAVILKLQEQGKLSLDDTIDKWLPDIAAKITNGENLTIRQILNGTGGLPDYVVCAAFLSEVFADYLSGSNRDWQPEDLVAYVFGKPLFSGGTPSEIWTYTNTGNVLAALIAEEATGKPFKQILAEEILQPLGLNNTFFTSEDVSLERRARLYGDFFTADGNLGQDGILEDYSIVNTAILYGAGSIVSSAKDVAIFFDSLASGDLLSSESTAEIFNYVNTGTPEIDDRFGLGVFPADYPWGETRSMNGSFLGNNISYVDYFLNSDTTISVLVNNDTPRSILASSAYKASIANALGLNNGSVINGTEGNDLLKGTSKNNDVINGFEGNDILIGKKGKDALDGGAGDDLLKGGKDDDVLFGKEGNDNLLGGKGNDLLNGGVGDDLLKGGKGFDLLIGGDGQDTIKGGKDSDILDGGAGNDILRDTQGDNVLYGNDGDDRLFVGKGNDQLYGDAGSDTLVGGAGSDTLVGGVGSDTLVGGSGNDILVGEEIASGSPDPTISITLYIPPDTLTGGLGADLFVLGARTGSFYLAGGTGQFAEITDFDRIQGDSISVFDSGQISDYSFSYDRNLEQTDLFFKQVHIAEFNTLNVDNSDLIFV